MSVSILTIEEVKEIKGLLWHSYTHKEISIRYRVSAIHIGRIFRGEAWADVPWPDGSRGAITAEKRAAILRTRHAHSRQPSIYRDEGSALAEAAGKVGAREDASFRSSMTPPKPKKPTPKKTTKKAKKK